MEVENKTNKKIFLFVICDHDHTRSNANPGINPIGAGSNVQPFAFFR